MAFADAEKDTSPGHPYNQEFATKGEVMEQATTEVVLRILRRLKVLSSDLLDDFTAEELIALDAADMIDMFVKMEPHALKKILSGKIRLISGVSLVDTTIERMIHSPINKAMMGVNAFIPFKPGMGLHDDGKKALWNYVQAFMGIICSTDISSWDWSVPGWLLRAEMMLRLMLYRTNVHSAIGRILYNRHIAYGKSTYVTRFGDVFHSCIIAIVLSGSYITSSGNSFMRHILARVVRSLSWIEWMFGMSMGDDMVEVFFEGIIEAYRALGFSTRGAAMFTTDHFEFCSTLFDGDWRGSPVNYWKTMTRFVTHGRSHPDVKMFEEQLRYEMRHQPAFVRGGEIDSNIQKWKMGPQD